MKTRTSLPIAQTMPTAFAGPGWKLVAYPGLMSSVQVFLGFLNFCGEVAIPATACCFCEIETETRDSFSPASHSSFPRARTAPLTILSGDSNWDRMYSPPSLGGSFAPMGSALLQARGLCADRIA